jgi:hypothetical protein
MATAEQWIATVLADVEQRKARNAQKAKFVESNWASACETATSTASEVEPEIQATIQAFAAAFPRFHVTDHGSKRPSAVPLVDQYPPAHERYIVCNGETFTMAFTADGVSCNGGAMLFHPLAVQHLRTWLGSLVMPPPLIDKRGQS